GDDQKVNLGPVVFDVHVVHGHHGGLDDGHDQNDEKAHDGRQRVAAHGGIDNERNQGGHDQGAANNHVDSDGRPVPGMGIMRLRHDRSSQEAKKGSDPFLGQPLNQIQKREQKDPHNIDKVPVQARVFDQVIVLRPEDAPGRHDEHDNENHQPAQD